jgi:hypothetical protein
VTDFGLHSGICRIIVFLSLLSQTKIIEIFGMSLKSIVTLHQRLKKQFINLEITPTPDPIDTKPVLNVRVLESGFVSTKASLNATNPDNVVEFKREDFVITPLTAAASSATLSSTMARVITTAPSTSVSSLVS